MNVLVCAHIWYVCTFLVLCPSIAHFFLITKSIWFTASFSSRLCMLASFLCVRLVYLSKSLLSKLTVNVAISTCCPIQVCCFGRGSNRGSMSVITCFVVVLCSKFNEAGWENFFHMVGIDSNYLVNFISPAKGVYFMKKQSFYAVWKHVDSLNSWKKNCHRKCFVGYRGCFMVCPL